MQPMFKSYGYQACVVSSTFLILGLAPFSSALAEEEVSVTPYRPTVSNPAALSAPGWLEVELGVNQQRPGDGSQQGSLPYLLKYAFTQDFGILLAGEAHRVQSDADGTRLGGLGDTQLLLKHRWGLGDGENDPALGLEWGFKSPTARNGLGSGKTDYIINGIYSAELAGNTFDLNINATRLGVFDAGTGQTKWGWAATLSHALDERWGIAAELSGAARRGTLPENQALMAVAYTLSKRVVLDFGMAVGVSRAAADRNFFAGVSFLLDKLR